MKTKFISATGLLLLFSIFLLHSCWDDSKSFQDNNATILREKKAEEHLSFAQQWFEKNRPIKNAGRKKPIEEKISKIYMPSMEGNPSWKYYAVSTKNNITVVDVDVTDKITQDFVTKESLDAYKKTNDWNLRRSYTRFVHTKNNLTGEEDGFYMTIIPSRYYAKTYSNRIKRTTYLKRDKYLSGFILFHNLEGKFTNGWEYKRGKIIHKIIPSSSSNKDAEGKLILIKLNAKYEVSPALHKKRKKRDSSEFGDEPIELPPTEVEGTTTHNFDDDFPDMLEGYENWFPDIIPPSPNDDGNYQPYEPEDVGSGGYGSGDDSTDKIIKDKSFKNSKADCVLKSIEKSGGSIKKIIQKFDGDFPVSHLKFSLNNLPNNLNATTDYPENYITTITINENNLSRPNLSIARTIIHEVLHAEIFRKMLSIAKANGELSVEIFYDKLYHGDEYPGIFDFYKRYTNDNSSDPQHEQLASYYVKTMITALKKIDPNQKEEIYEALAWEGLKKTTEWKNMKPAIKEKLNKIAEEFDKKGREECP